MVSYIVRMIAYKGWTVSYIVRMIAYKSWMVTYIVWMIAYKDWTVAYIVRMIAYKSRTVSYIVRMIAYKSWMVSYIVRMIAYKGWTVSILELYAEQTAPLLIYPNPNNGIFTIEAIMNTPLKTEIEIYNINGRKIYSGNTNKSVTDINLTGNARGLYFVRMSNERWVKTGKVMVY